MLPRPHNAPKRVSQASLLALLDHTHQPKLVIKQRDGSWIVQVRRPCRIRVGYAVADSVLVVVGE